MSKKWYVIHTQTGCEEKVKLALEKKVQQENKQELITGIFIPKEKVAEIKHGKKNISERKFFPGYILVEMELNDESWYLINNSAGVSGFIKSGSKPVPLSDEEVGTILKQTETAQEKPMPKVMIETGESVRVKEGPFTNFTGIVEEANPLKGKLKVSITIFGRATPVELEYWQVEKI